MAIGMVKLQKPYNFLSPFEAHEFVAWVVAEDVELDREEMYQISLSLVKAGCRFAVCSGIECSIWDDAIDYAAMEVFPDTEHDEGTLVMTSWHENETFDEIAHFMTHCTSFEDFVPDNFLVVSIGGNSGQRALELVKKSFAGKSN